MLGSAGVTGRMMTLMRAACSQQVDGELRLAAMMMRAGRWSASVGWRMASIGWRMECKCRLEDGERRLPVAMMMRASAGGWSASVGWQMVSVGCRRR
jgi:hypothetical protein